MPVGQEDTCVHRERLNILKRGLHIVFYLFVVVGLSPLILLVALIDVSANQDLVNERGEKE